MFYISHNVDACLTRDLTDDRRLFVGRGCFLVVFVFAMFLVHCRCDKRLSATRTQHGKFICICFGMLLLLLFDNMSTPGRNEPIFYTCVMKHVPTGGILARVTLSSTPNEDKQMAHFPHPSSLPKRLDKEESSKATRPCSALS